MGRGIPLLLATLWSGLLVAVPNVPNDPTAPAGLDNPREVMADISGMPPNERTQLFQNYWRRFEQYYVYLQGQTEGTMEERAENASRHTLFTREHQTALSRICSTSREGIERECALMSCVGFHKTTLEMCAEAYDRCGLEPQCQVSADHRYVPFSMIPNYNQVRTMLSSQNPPPPGSTLPPGGSKLPADGLSAPTVAPQASAPLLPNPTEGNGQPPASEPTAPSASAPPTVLVNNPSPAPPATINPPPTTPTPSTTSTTAAHNAPPSQTPTSSNPSPSASPSFESVLVDALRDRLSRGPAQPTPTPEPKPAGGVHGGGGSTNVSRSQRPHAIPAPVAAWEARAREALSAPSVSSDTLSSLLGELGELSEQVADALGSPLSSSAPYSGADISTAPTSSGSLGTVGDVTDPNQSDWTLPATAAGEGVGPATEGTNIESDGGTNGLTASETGDNALSLTGSPNKKQAGKKPSERTAAGPYQGPRTVPASTVALAEHLMAALEARGQRPSLKGSPQRGLASSKVARFGGQGTFSLLGRPTSWAGLWGAWQDIPAPWRWLGSVWAAIGTTLLLGAWRRRRRKDRPAPTR